MDAVRKSLEEYIEYRDRAVKKTADELRGCTDDRERLKRKMTQSPAHASHSKWAKTRAALKVTRKDLQKKQKIGVVLPPSVIKNNCEGIFTDNPNLNYDINNQSLDSRVARRLVLVMQLLDHFPRSDFARTPACVYNLKDAGGNKVFKGSRKGAKVVDLYPMFIDNMRVWVTAYHVRVEQGQTLLHKIVTGEVNKPAAALLVLIPKAIEAASSALSSFVLLMTSPVLGGAFVEKDGTLMAVTKANLLNPNAKHAIYPSATTWVMERLASGHTLVPQLFAVHPRGCASCASQPFYCRLLTCRLSWTS